MWSLSSIKEKFTSDWLKELSGIYWLRESKKGLDEKLWEGQDAASFQEEPKPGTWTFCLLPLFLLLSETLSFSPMEDDLVHMEKYRGQEQEPSFIL